MSAWMDGWRPFEPSLEAVREAMFAGDPYVCCTIECERVVDCAVCGMRKAPIGRDPGVYAAGSYCPHECPGHDEDPRGGHLWPGELARIRRDAIDDDPASVTIYLGDADWHDGPGWYYVIDDYPDEGSCGAFATRDECERIAAVNGYTISGVGSVSPASKTHAR